MLLDGPDDGGVESDAGVEAEEAAVHPSESDRPEVASVDTGGEQIGGCHRVVRQAERPSEHVRRPAGEYAECGVGTGDASRDLVQCAVAAVPDHDIDAPARGIMGEPGRMAAPIGLDDLDVVPAGETPVHDDRIASGH